MSKITDGPRAARLKRDFVIPAGTVFENIGGTITDYHSGNFEVVMGITTNHAMPVICDGKGDFPGWDEYFEEVH